MTKAAGVPTARPQPVPNPCPTPGEQGRKRAKAGDQHCFDKTCLANWHCSRNASSDGAPKAAGPHALYEEKQWLAMFGPFFGPSLWLTGRQHYTCINSALRALGPEAMLRTSREKGLCGGLGLDLRLQGLDLGLITCLDGH